MRTVDPWEIAEENPAIIIGGVSTLFVAIRILGVAHFDPETASEVLQSGGTAAIILGTTLSVIGIVLAVILMIYALALEYRIMAAHTTNMNEPRSGTLQKNKNKRSINEGFRIFIVLLVAAALLALV